MQESNSNIVGLKDVDVYSVHTIIRWVYEADEEVVHYHHESHEEYDLLNPLHTKCLFSVLLVADRLVMNDLLTTMYQELAGYFSEVLKLSGSVNDPDKHFSPSTPAELDRETSKTITADFLEEVSKLPDHLRDKCQSETTLVIAKNTDPGPSAILVRLGALKHYMEKDFDFAFSLCRALALHVDEQQDKMDEHDEDEGDEEGSTVEL